MTQLKLLDPTVTQCTIDGKTYSVGDWLFHEFTLKMIKEIRDLGGDAYSADLSDGYGCTSGQGILQRTRPLTLRNKQISDEIHYFETQLRVLDGIQFNWPDLHRWFENKWWNSCDTLTEEERGNIYAEVNRQVSDILEKVKGLEDVTIGDYRLFKRKH